MTSDLVTVTGDPELIGDGAYSDLMRRLTEHGEEKRINIRRMISIRSIKDVLCNT